MKSSCICSYGEKEEALKMLALWAWRSEPAGQHSAFRLCGLLFYWGCRFQPFLLFSGSRQSRPPDML